MIMASSKKLQEVVNKAIDNQHQDTKSRDHLSNDPQKKKLADNLDKAPTSVNQPANQPLGSLAVKQDSNTQRSIYDAVLPIILSQLDRPKTINELVETLDVNNSQLKCWLQQAVAEKKIEKKTKPVRYGRLQSHQPCLFEVS